MKIAVHSIRGAINNSYIQRRGISSGIDVNISDRELAAFMGRKFAARGRAILHRFPHAFIEEDVTILNRNRLTIASGVSIGRGVLIDALAENGISLGCASTIDVNAVVRGSGSIRRLGKGVRVGPRAAIGAFNFIHGGGGVDIGEDVLLGPDVKIFSENHNFAHRSLPIIEQGETPAEVRIGSGAWIGASTTILAGVEIGEGAIIAAGSVVSRSVDPYIIAAGSPAKKLRDRAP